MSIKKICLSSGHANQKKMPIKRKCPSLEHVHQKNVYRVDMSIVLRMDTRRLKSVPFNRKFQNYYRRNTNMKYAYSLLELVIHSIYHYVEYIISIFNTKPILFLLSAARENVIT